MMEPRRLDPRRNAYREDVAAKHLEGRVRAARYETGEVLQISAPSAPVRSAPRFEAPLLTEALSGELITVYDMNNNWAWGQLNADGYVGYVAADCLSRMPEMTTHRVANRATFVYSAPDIKSPPFMRLSFGAELIVFGIDGKFAELSRGGFAFAGHLIPREDVAKDFVRVAERLIGAPYLWGGKTTNGLDCSALVQLSLNAAGLSCPRDSDMQEAEVGEPLPKADLAAVQRGDLIFWKGHVAVATSPDFLIHANAYHMETAVEPIRRAVDRISDQGGPVTSIRRIPAAQLEAVAQGAANEAKPLSVTKEEKVAAIAQQIEQAASPKAKT
jgi:cell wall-associated NlpC family hydrolase